MSPSDWLEDDNDDFPRWDDDDDDENAFADSFDDELEDDFDEELDAEGFELTGCTLCPNCNLQIYEDAPLCPFCNEVLAGTKRRFLDDKPAWYVLLAVLGILAVIFALAIPF